MSDRRELYEEWFIYMMEEGDPALMEIYAEAALKGIPPTVVSSLNKLHVEPVSYIESNYYFDTLREHNIALDEALNVVTPHNQEPKT